MPRYKTRSNEITAVQVSVDNAEAVKELIGDKGDLRPYLEHDFAAVVETATGVKVAFEGDYVYSDSDGLHVSRQAAFEAVFEPVEAEKPASTTPATATTTASK